MAATGSPTADGLGRLPGSAGSASGSRGSTLRSATSAFGSSPTISALTRLPSANIHVDLPRTGPEPLSVVTTWALVAMWPSPSRTNPEPARTLVPRMLGPFSKIEITVTTPGESRLEIPPRRSLPRGRPLHHLDPGGRGHLARGGASSPRRRRCSRVPGVPAPRRPARPLASRRGPVCGQLERERCSSGPGRTDPALHALGQLTGDRHPGRRRGRRLRCRSARTPLPGCPPGGLGRCRHRRARRHHCRGLHAR